MKPIMEHIGIVLACCFVLFAGMAFSQSDSKRAPAAATSPAPAPAQANGMSESMAGVVSWQSSFTSETLSDNDLEGFEERAKQKIKDFYNYIAIASNPKYDTKMRQEAERQALDIFSTGNCNVWGIPVKKFLDSCLGMTQAYNWQAYDVKVKDKFTKQNGDKEYTGTLTCTISNGDKTVEKEVSITLVRKEKQFGSSSEMVWTVTICDIQ